MQAASVAKQCYVSGAVDTILATLLRFTGLADAAAPPAATVAQLAGGRLAQAAVAALFDIAAEHADMLRHGWTTALDAIMRLHVLRLLDPSVFLDASVRAPHGSRKLACAGLVFRGSCGCPCP